MKSNFQVAQKVALFAFSIAASATLLSCAKHEDGAMTTPPPAPGTLQSSPKGPLSTGSFQGSVLDKSGVAQAILTLDVWEKDGQTGAQITISPNGATAIVPLSANRHSFAADFPVVVSGVNTTVSISGEWTGSNWTGQLAILDEATNTFVLSAGASAQAAIAVGIPTGTYEGVLKSKTGGSRTISLVINPATDFGTALASTLSSHVMLSGSLKYADAPQEPLTDLVWDRETSTLSATGSIPTKAGPASLSCKMSEMNSRNRDILQCAIGGSKSLTSLATGALQQKHIAVAPPYSKPSSKPSSGQSPLVSQPAAPTDFVGSAVFTSAQGQKQTRTLTLSVSLAVPSAGQTAGQPQPAKVKFILDGSRVGASFNEGTYNSATGELYAKQLLNLGALPGLLELSCHGVQFETSQYDFTCHYESSVTNVTGEFHLQGLQGSRP